MNGDKEENNGIQREKDRKVGDGGQLRACWGCSDVIQEAEKRSGWANEKRSREKKKDRGCVQFETAIMSHESTGKKRGGSNRGEVNPSFLP